MADCDSLGGFRTSDCAVIMMTSDVRLERLTDVGTVVSLSFTTSYLLGSGVAVEHSLQFGPASPKDEPPWLVIAFAVLMTAEAGQGIKKLVNGHRFSDLLVSPNAEYVDVVRRQNRRRSTCLGVWAPACVAQV